MSIEANQKAFAEAIRSGDREAYEQVFRFYYGKLCSYAYSLLKDRVRAEDVVQTIFLRIWEQRNENPLPNYLKNYLYRSVHNEAINLLRHDKVVRDSRETIEDTYDEWKAPAEDDTKQQSKRKALLKKGIAELPDRTRETFILCRQEGLTYKEAAEVMGVSHKTVEAQMGRALRKLREHLASAFPLFISTGVIICQHL